MKQIGKTLYDLDSKGDIKEWSVYHDGPEVVLRYGKEGGRIQEKRTTSKGKNLGRSNETSPEQQAEKEATAKYAKQIKKGYKDSKSNLGSLTLPPLAKKYQDSKNAIKWPAYGSYKLDGVRMTAFYENGKVRFQSRGGEDYPVIEEIAEELKQVFFNVQPELVIDGELYCHGMYLEDITAAVKKHNEDTKKLEFHIFDMYDPLCEEAPLKARYQGYKTMLAFSSADINKLVGLTQLKLHNEDELLAFHKIVTDQGYEGIVIRNMDSLFKFNQRTSDFQKYKVQMDDEFLVVNYEQGKNGCVSAVCEVNVGIDTKTFKAPLIGTMEYQQKVFDNYLTGVYATIKFEKYSKYGIPTKPKMKCFRDVNDKGDPLV